MRRGRSRWRSKVLVRGGEGRVVGWGGEVVLGEIVEERDVVVGLGRAREDVIQHVGRPPHQGSKILATGPCALIVTALLTLEVSRRRRLFERSW